MIHAKPKARVIHRALITISELPRPSAATLTAALEAVGALRMVPELDDAQRRFRPSKEGGVSAHYREAQLVLRHELSRAMEHCAGPFKSQPDHRSGIEAAAARHHLPAYLAAVDSEDASLLEQVLLAALREMVSGAAGARSRGVFLQPKRQGAAILKLPSADDAQRRFRFICQAGVARERALPPLLYVTWLYVLLLNAHPMKDGNGRLARLLMNLELMRHGMPSTSYLPIYEAMTHSFGGYEIRLREAEIFNRWDPLVLYFSRIILLAAGVSR